MAGRTRGQPRNRPPRAVAVCASAALVDGGPGVRFEATWVGDPWPAFVVRFEGRVYGYLNRCMHVPYELDSGSGEFFDDDGRQLLCSTHGATYEPRSGLCTFGPCKGMSLIPLEVEERRGRVYCRGVPDDYL